MLQDLISIAVAAGGVGLIALAIRQARSKGWAGSLQLAAGGLLLIGASAIGIVDFLAGIALSPHLYRHIIAKIVAERAPELLTDLSRRLGHKSINTTYQA